MVLPAAAGGGGGGANPPPPGGGGGGANRPAPGGGGKRDIIGYNFTLSECITRKDYTDKRQQAKKGPPLIRDAERLSVMPTQTTTDE